MPDMPSAHTTPANTPSADTTSTDTTPADAGPATEAGTAVAAGAAGAATPSDGGLVAITDSGPMIVATVALSGCEPGRALAAFTDPVVLARWWRGELTADLVPGGHYTVSFPKIPARMVGNVVSYVPGRSLEFSWAWDGEDEPPSTVTVKAEPADAGGSTVLTVEHGPHGEDEAGRKAHSEHWEGWEFFLPRLPDAVSR
jgi:uncharacterized protein YndB with AHSA1/START domain